MLPWRIENESGYAVKNFSNLIYPTLYEYRFYLNKTTGNYDQDKQSIVPMEKCNMETANIKEFYENYNISEWYCPNWLSSDEYLFGGLWDDDFVFYYELKIGYCPNAESYSAEKNCTSSNDLNKILLSDNPYYISILYPRYTMDSNQFNNPINIAFQNYYYLLSVELHKTDRIFVKKAELYDDKGRIFTDIVKYSITTFSRFASDFSFHSMNNYYKEGIPSSFYNLNNIIY